MGLGWVGGRGEGGEGEGWIVRFALSGDGSAIPFKGSPLTYPPSSHTPRSIPFCRFLLFSPSQPSSPTSFSITFGPTTINLYSAPLCVPRFSMYLICGFGLLGFLLSSFRSSPSFCFSVVRWVSFLIGPSGSSWFLFLFVLSPSDSSFFLS